MAVQTSTIRIPTPGGSMPAFLAVPDGAGPRPAVVVLMEAFGLVPHIEHVAQRIAAEGYLALAPDLYYRQLPAQNKFGYDSLDGAIATMQKLGDDAFIADMGAALDALQARSDCNGKVGVTGFCMGGRLSFLTACRLPQRIACAAPFYGGGIAGHLDLADRIQCPLSLFFGEKDAYIPLDQVEKIDGTLKRLRKNFKLEVYPGADHGFFCDERPSYDARAAADSWAKLKQFFAAHLR
jgi:carboxymethylenebutenolidase